MTDLTPFRELASEFTANSVAADKEAKAHSSHEAATFEFLKLAWLAAGLQLREAIAAIESANPWIPVENGLPEPSDTVLWDVWCIPNDDDEFPPELVKRQYQRVVFARDEFRASPREPFRIRYVTHYRRHVPEKGPSE